MQSYSVLDYRQPFAEFELALLFRPHLYSCPFQTASRTMALHAFIPGDTLFGKPAHGRAVYESFFAGMWISIDKSWSQQIGC